MLKRVRLGWHKARALSALQTYLNLPLKEPLPRQAELQLLRLSEKGISEGVSPLDTAFRYYGELVTENLAQGSTLDQLGFFGALGRLNALKGRLSKYHEHHEMMLVLSKAEEAYRQ